MHGPAGKRIDGKSSRITEQIQDIATAGIFLHQSPVFTLVQEKPRLLP